MLYLADLTYLYTKSCLIVLATKPQQESCLFCFFTMLLLCIVYYFLFLSFLILILILLHDHSYKEIVATIKRTKHEAQITNEKASLSSSQDIKCCLSIIFFRLTIELKIISQIESNCSAKFKLKWSRVLHNVTYKLQVISSPP